MYIFAFVKKDLKTVITEKTGNYVWNSRRI